MLQHYFKGYFEVLSGAILFGLIGIFVKLIKDMPLGSIIFYRLLFAIAIIALYLSCCGRFNEIKLGKKRRYILLLGLFQAGAMFSYFTAIKYTTVSIAVLLLYTAPVYVTLLSPLVLKEKITGFSIAALFISIAGVVMVVEPRALFPDVFETGTDILGVVSGLFAGLFYALMILSSRHLRNDYSGTAQASWAFIITLFVFLPYSVAVSKAVLIDNIYILLLFGLLPTAAGAILYLNGLRLVRAQNASVIGLLEPVSAVFFAYVILNEPVSLITLIGGALILTGALLSGREKPIETALT